MQIKPFISLVFLYLFCSGHCFGFDDVTFYCFNAFTNLKIAENRFRPILLPRDRVVHDQSRNCLGIMIEEERRDLFEAHLRNNFSDYRIEYPKTKKVDESGIISREQCHIELEKVSYKNLKGNDVGLKKGKPYAVYSQNNNKSVDVSTLILMSGRTGSLGTETDYLRIKCTVLGSGSVSLDISLAGAKNSVSTTISVNKNQKINLGGIIQQLKDEEKTVDLSGEVKVFKQQGPSQVEYWLTVK